MWCWRCGVGTVFQQWTCRRTKCQQGSSHTLLHCYSLRVRRREGRAKGDVYPNVIVKSRITFIRTDKTPRQIILSKPAFRTASTNSFIGHRNINLSSPPHFPVTVTSYAVATQQLRKVLKPLWMSRIWLVLGHCCDHSVVVRQFDGSLDCVCVNCEFRVIWRKNENRNRS